MEFAADYAVTEINQAGTGVAFDFTARMFKGVEEEDGWGFLDLFGFVCGEVEDRSFALAGFVKAGADTGQRLFKNGGKRAAFFFDLRGEGSESDCVDHFEGAKFPGEAPAHGAINVHNVVRNFAHAAPGVEAHFGKAAPDELLRLVGFLIFKERSEQGAQTLAGIFDCLASFDRGEARFLFFAVLHGVEVESENFFFALAPLHAFVKALAGFVAKPFALGHLFDEGGNFVGFARFVVGSGLINIFDYVHQNVEPDDVRSAKSGGLGPADGGAGAGVHFFDGHAEGLHQAERVQHREGADAIGDEIWRVFGEDDAFAESASAKIGERTQNCG